MELDNFEWDQAKADSNLAKHGIDFKEAAKVFLDPYRVGGEITDRNHREVRYDITGAVRDLILYVVYTKRGNKIRIISARRASRNERRRYRKF